MNFRKSDYFSELYISPNKRFNKEDVENKYELIKSEAKKTENNIYDETIRKRSAEQKMEQLNKLNEWREIKDKAYQYCSVSGNIVLRNAIINTGNLTTIKEVKRNDDDINGCPVMKKTVRDIEGLETPDFDIVQTEKYDLVDGIKKLPIQVKRYRVAIQIGGESFEYDFYTEDLDIVKLHTNMQYRQAVLRAIEINNMQNFGNENDINNTYIGTIVLDENDNYCISKSEKIRQAVGVRQRNLFRKPKNSIDDKGHSSDIQEVRE